MKKNIKYEEAVRELENIVAQMENGQLDIDTLSAPTKLGSFLAWNIKDT